MSMKQFTYTATPWGVDAPGWSVFQSTEGLAPAVARSFRAYYAYENLEGEEKSPRKLTFAGREGHGQTIVSQGCDCGLRWWDRKRGANYFSHVYLGDANEALAGVGLDFNPMAWYGAPCFQEDFPEELKQEAERKDRPELPPHLPVAEGLAGMETNHDFEDDELFARAEWYDWGKIGALAEWMHRRANGKEKQALAFDARMATGVDAMALALRLLPLQERMDAVFSTWMTNTEKGSFPDGEKMLFYGTVQDGEADADTGVYEKIPTGKLTFAGRRDAELFKRMVDMCGEELGAENWDELVACWEVAAGRVDNQGQLRDAVKFAKGFPGLEAEVEKGLEGAFADSGVGSDGERAVALVAWFELGMPAFGDVAKEICGECAGDGVLFEGALRALEGDVPKAAFLDETYEQAKSLEELPRLAATWMGCGSGTKRLAPAGGGKRPFGRFAALVDRFEGIRSNARQKIIPDKNAEGLLQEVERAEAVLGSGFDGMEETKEALRRQAEREKRESGYRAALEKVKGLGDLETFAREASFLGIERKRIREDGLRKVPLGRIPADQLEEAVAAYGAIGVKPGEIIASVPDDRLLVALDALVAIGADRDDIIRRAMAAAAEAAVARGYEKGWRDARQRAEEEARTRNRRHFWVMLRTALIGVALMALCFAAGYGLRCLTGKEGQKTGERTEKTGEAAAGTATGGGKEETAQVHPPAEPRPSVSDPEGNPGPGKGTPPATETGSGGSQAGHGTGDKAEKWNNMLHGKEKQDEPDPNGGDAQKPNRLVNKRSVHQPSDPENRNAGLAAGNDGRQTRLEERKGIPGPGLGSPKGQGQGLGAGGAATGSGGADGIPPPVPAPVQESGENVGDAGSVGGIQAVAGEIALSGKEGGANGGVGPTGIHGGGGAGIRTGGNGR